MNNLRSGTIKNEALTITSEHQYSEDHFERKFQDNSSPSDQSLEKKINRVQGKVTHRIKHVVFRTHSK